MVRLADWVESPSTVKTTPGLDTVRREAGLVGRERVVARLDAVNAEVARRVRGRAEGAAPWDGDAVGVQDVDGDAGHAGADDAVAGRRPDGSGDGAGPQVVDDVVQDVLPLVARQVDDRVRLERVRLLVIFGAEGFQTEGGVDDFAAGPARRGDRVLGVDQARTARRRGRVDVARRAPAAAGSGTGPGSGPRATPCWATMVSIWPTTALEPLGCWCSSRGTAGCRARVGPASRPCASCRSRRA